MRKTHSARRKIDQKNSGKRYNNGEEKSLTRRKYVCSLLGFPKYPPYVLRFGEVCSSKSENFRRNIEDEGGPGEGGRLQAGVFADFGKAPRGAQNACVPNSHVKRRIYICIFGDDVGYLSSPPRVYPSHLRGWKFEKVTKQDEYYSGNSVLGSL